MSRASVAIIASSTLLLLVFGTFATSHIWLSGSREIDLGTGIVVVGTFFLLHAAVTVALVWATLSAATAWQKAAVLRKAIDGIILLFGVIASILASSYAIFFVVG